MSKLLMLSLLCPFCKRQLRTKNNVLLCDQCNKQYPIYDEIPVFIGYSSQTKHLIQQLQYFTKESQNFPSNNIFQEWEKNYIRRWEDNFPNIKDSTIVDCGTGRGYMAIVLAKKGAYVIAVDIIFQNLLRIKKIAEKLGISKRIEYICAKAECLPIKNNSVDYYVANAVLEHIDQEGKVIREIDRVCKKQAGLMITAPLSYRRIFPLLIPINYIHDKKIGHLRRYNKEILKKKLKNWRLQKAYYTGHTKKVLKTIINSFFGKRYDEKEIERDDTKLENIPMWSSNIICFFRKK